MPVQIIIGTSDDDKNGISDDIDALARLVKDETSTLITTMVNTQGFTQEQAFRIATESIVAEVINRAASNSTTIFGGTTVQGVINHSGAYERVGSHGGSWTGLAEAETEYVEAVKSYLMESVVLGTGSTLIGVSNDSTTLSDILNG